MYGRTVARYPVPHLLIVWLAGAFVGGIAASATFGAGAWPLAAAIAAACGAAALARWSWIWGAYAVVLPAIFLAGVVRELGGQPSLAADDVARHAGASRLVRGVVRDDPEIGETTQRFAVDVRQVQRTGAWRDASGGMLVRAPLLPRYRAGDVVELRGELELPPELEGFDYAAYLARRGVSTVMDYPRAEVIGRDGPPWWRAAALRTRRELARGIELALPEPQASLAQGVLLGRRSALPDDVRADLNATNTSHLVVVSGSNVVLLSSFCAIAFGWLLGRRRALWLSLATVVAYAMLVGLSPPVARATIMGALLIGATMSGRRTSGVTSLLLAAAIMAGIDPAVPRDVSFQLSFGATAGILVLASPLRRRTVDVIGWLLRRDEVPRWMGSALAEPIAVTVAATLATAPLLAMHFGRVSLVTLPANMAIVPVFPLMLGTSALAGIGGLLPFGHVASGAPAYVLLSYWLRFAAWMADLPGASLSIAGYTTRWLMATYALIGAGLVVSTRMLRRAPQASLAESRPFRWRDAGRRSLWLAPVAVVLVSAGWIAFGDAPRRLEVTMLDVGQGEAILIETPSGRDVLVDGGPGGAVLRGLGGELAWHDRSLDLVLLTHAQADHATGLLDVFGRYDVRAFAWTAPDSGSAVEPELRRAADGEGVDARVVAAGDVFDLGDGVRLEVLWPPPGASIPGNDGSVVLRLSWGEVSFLLTGDIESATEAQLVASGAVSQATVLKVAHHGSGTSSTAAFVDAADPQVSVISVGAGNRFGHPVPDVVERLSATSDVYVTADDGAVHFATDGRQLWVETER